VASSPTRPATLQVARIVTATPAEGPGLRSALWVQGCTLRCPDCFNPQTWSRAGGTAMAIGDVVHQLAEDPRIEGCTIMGGEPFEQAAAVADVAEAMQDKGLGVITFTGHTRDQLQGRTDLAVLRLLAATDLLIDGPYLRDLPDRERPLVGSSNQAFHLLTDRYRWWVDRLSEEPDRLNVRLLRTGAIEITGWVPDRTRTALLAPLEASRLSQRQMLDRPRPA